MFAELNTTVLLNL